MPFEGSLLVHIPDLDLSQPKLDSKKRTCKKRRITAETIVELWATQDVESETEPNFGTAYCILDFSDRYSRSTESKRAYEEAKRYLSRVIEYPLDNFVFRFEPGSEFWNLRSVPLGDLFYSVSWEDAGRSRKEVSVINKINARVAARQRAQEKHQIEEERAMANLERRLRTVAQW